MRHLRYSEDIDALRGVAVLLVVIYHAFPSLIPGGFIGVDVFFVISGYLITSIMLLSMQDNKFSLQEFYARRIRRLFPALITVLLFSLIVGWLVLFPDEYAQLGSHVSKSVVFWLNFTLIDEVGYFDVESHYKPLLHFWTLSIEEQYYLIWPLILLLFLKFNKHPLYLFGFIFVASLLANLYFAADYTQETYYHTLTRFWQLSAGSLLAMMLLNKEVRSNKLYLLGGVVVIAFSAVVINSEMAYPGYWAILPVVGASLVILSNGNLPTYLGLSKLGLISYPLYLWHWVLISFLYVYLGRQPGVYALLIAIALSLVFSFLTYKYIEKLRYRKKSTSYLITALIAIGLVGVYIEKEKGLVDRVSIDYVSELASQFKRTPAKDDICVKDTSEILGEKQLFDYCRAESLQKDKLLAIIGDSHAHALFPGMADIAKQHGFGALLLANSSCPPLVGFMWGRNPSEEQLCKTKIDQILSVLAKNSLIEKVIVVTRGPVYIHGEVDGVFSTESIGKSLKTIKLDKQTYQTYFNGYRATLDRIEAMKNIKQVFYMLENPELDFLPKEVIPRPYDVFGISSNRNTMDREFYLKRMGEYRSSVDSVEYSKLSILDPINTLCDTKKCISYKDGHFLYADDDHFSVYGSQYIAKYFESNIFKGYN